jgi:hypothetical protein
MNYGSQTVEIEPMGTRRMEAALVFDMRTERRFQLPHGMSVSAVVDVFNITNSNAETDIVVNSGSTYGWPSTVLPPLVVRFGAKFSW